MHFALLMIILGLVIFHVYTRFGRMGKLANKIDGPLTLPIIGSTLPFLFLDDAGAWDFLRKTMNTFYPITKIWSVAYPVIITRDPDDIKLVMSDKTNIQKSSIYSVFHVWVENGLVTSHGKLWQQRRKVMTPAFYPNVLKRYVEITNQKVEKGIEHLKSEGECIQSVMSIVGKIVIAIVTSASMGLDEHSGSSKKELEDYYSYAHDLHVGMAFRIYRPYIPQWAMNFFSVGRRQSKAVKNINGIAIRLINQRRQYHEKSNYKFTEADEDVEGFSSGERKKFAVIDYLLAAEKQNLIDKKGVQAETDTFVGASFDTTATSAVFTLLLLAENKEIQDLARAEALDIYDQCNGNFSLGDLNNLEYIERSVKESLRLYPTVPMVGRKVEQELQLKNHLVPRGAEIFVAICDVHRDPKYWPNPEKFDPDRFLPEEVKARNPHTYLPFSAGPRSCIGPKFAMIMLKTIVAIVLCNFYLEPVTHTSEVKIKGHMVMSTVDPIKIKFIPIDKKKKT